MTTTHVAPVDGSPRPTSRTAALDLPPLSGLPTIPALEVDLTVEQIRSRHLERLLVLDTPAEERFERITRLATSLFGVPMATVALTDGGHGRFVGPTGFEDSSVPVARQTMFCDHTVTLGQPMVVEDATADDRFADLPSVVGAPYLRFYAGIPLADDEGVVVGTFCLFDTVPRRLDRMQMSMLLELASWARRELVDSADMSRARDVQQALLPARPPRLEGWEVAATCRPTRSVGGDFYDVGRLDGGLVFCLMDVMGKGVGAALVAATVRALLRASVGRDGRPWGGRGDGSVARTVADVDALVRDDLENTQTLVTGFLAHLDTQTGVLRWVDAGHGLAVVGRAGGGWDRLHSDDLPIGIGLGSGWSEQHTVVGDGDTLLVVSDGLLDLLGGDDAALDQIGELARLDLAPDDLVDRIGALAGFGTAMDDVTLVAIRRRAVAA